MRSSAGPYQAVHWRKESKYLHILSTPSVNYKDIIIIIIIIIIYLLQLGLYPEAVVLP
jgi:hypothetical protein